MIAVDTSALVAVLLGEEDAERLARVMLEQPNTLSAANLLEASVVIQARQGDDAVRDLQLLLERCQTTIAVVDEEAAWAAHAAWRRFGKGRHPAGLNFGDCFAYAVSKSLGIPLLYKGNDFAQTDVTSALA